MKKSLKPEEENPYSLALCGMGAVGKTQIALAYALDNGYLYDSIWWLAAETDLAILTSYKDFLVQKGIIKKDIAYERQDILRSLWGWMSQHSNWLFIYDNAESEKDLVPYLPRINTGHILITTRNPHWRNTKKIDVGVFQPEEAVEFLQRFELEGSLDGAEKLAEELGYLPLALDQAAAYMSATKKSYQDYMDLFKTHRLELFGDVDYESAFYEQTVATTWTISLEKIANESAKQLIQLFAFLAPDRIYKDIFRQTSEYLPEPLSSAVRNELNFDKTVTELTRYSLIQTGKDRMSIHRLLQEVIRQSLGNKQVHFFHDCVRILHRLFTYDQYDMKTWDDCARLMPHVQSLLTHEKDLTIETEEIADLYAQGAGWLQYTALYEEALDWYKKAMAIYEKVLGSDHPSTATTYNNIATAYYKQGAYTKALDWYKKAMAIREKVLGPEHPSTATTYTNIARIYYNRGDYDTALDRYKKALAIREKVLVPSVRIRQRRTPTSPAHTTSKDYGTALDWYKSHGDLRESLA